MDLSGLLKPVADLPKPVIELGCGLLKSLLGKPCQVAGEMMADQVYYWRWRNRVRIAERAAKLLAEREVAAKALPPGFLLPLLERAGDCDDEDLQARWAALIASGVAEERHRHPAYSHLLSQLSRDEAVLLEALGAAAPEVVVELDWRPKAHVPMAVRLVRHSVPTARLHDSEGVWRALSHLQSLGLCEQTQIHEERLPDTAGPLMHFRRTLRYQLEDFGAAFAEAVGVALNRQQDDALR